MPDSPAKTITIRALRHTDVDTVDRVGLPARKYIGFLPKSAIEEIVSKKWGLGAFDERSELVGFVLFSECRDYFRIAQLCVAKGNEGRGVGKLLVDGVRERASSQFLIKLNCRREFPAKKFWERIGFVAIGEIPGRAKKGSTLLQFRYRLKDDDELGLWKSEATDEIQDIVIDAQIFFDLDAPVATNTQLGLDAPAELAQWFGPTRLFQPPITPETRMDELDAVTITDIRRVIKKYLKPDRMTVVGVGGANKTQIAEARKALKEMASQLASA